MSEYLGGPTFKYYFRMGWAYFWEREFSKIHPPPSLSIHLSWVYFREPTVIRTEMYVAYRGAMVVTHFMCYCDVGHSSRQLYKETIADWQTITQVHEIDHFHETELCHISCYAVFTLGLYWRALSLVSRPSVRGLGMRLKGTVLLMCPLWPGLNQNMPIANSSLFNYFSNHLKHTWNTLDYVRLLDGCINTSETNFWRHCCYSNNFLVFTMCIHG